MVAETLGTVSENMNEICSGAFERRGRRVERRVKKKKKNKKNRRCASKFSRLVDGFR